MRKRNCLVRLHLSRTELNHLQKQVSASGLSRERYLRALILGHEVKCKPCTHHADLIRKAAGLCNNANQLAHVANATGYARQDSVSEMVRITKELSAEIKELW